MNRPNPISFPINIALILAIALVISSCTFYQPTTIIPTTFTERNDKSISSSINAGAVYSNLAYSPVQHLYVHAEGALGLGYRMRYNFSGGLGSYYLLKPNLQIEGQVGIGKGEYDWGDPFNGMSEPSQINSAEGRMEYLSSYFAINFLKETGGHFSLAFRHQQIRFDYDYTTYDFVGKTAKGQQFGVHLIKRFPVLRNHLRYFIDLGFEQSNFSEYEYFSSPIILRLGLEFN